MKESLAEMMARLNDWMPSKKWINTSVGLVNTGNKNAALRSARKLVEMRAEQAKEESK